MMRAECVYCMCKRVSVKARNKVKKEIKYNEVEINDINTAQRKRKGEGRERDKQII